MLGSVLVLFLCKMVGRNTFGNLSKEEKGCNSC